MATCGSAVPVLMQNISDLTEHWTDSFRLQQQQIIFSHRRVLVMVPADAEMRQQLDGQREHDGRVLLGRNVGQRLQVAELKGCRRLGNDVRSFFESSGGLLFTLGGDDLGSGLAGGFGLGGHGSLQLLRQADILHFDSLHLEDNLRVINLAPQEVRT